MRCKATARKHWRPVVMITKRSPLIFHGFSKRSSFISGRKERHHPSNEVQMKEDVSVAERGHPAIDAAFSSRVAKTRHDLNNSIAHILGFSEMWLEELQEQAGGSLHSGLQGIFRTAG